MSRVRRNIVANYVGQIWASLMGFIFAPMYIHFMGIESYGIVGFCTSVAEIFFMLELGLGIAATRETARYAAVPGNEQALRNLLRTLELIYWLCGVLVGLTIYGLSDPIAQWWLKGEKLTQGVIRNAVIIMGLSLACRWPSAIYMGTLRGLQKQVLCNVITGITAGLRAGGSVLVLYWIAPTVQVFFVWRAITDSLQTLVSAFASWFSLADTGSRGTFKLDILKNIWRFSAGMTTTGVLFFILNQMDKIVLSTILPLDLFGYYSFAWVVAASLMGVVYPVTVAVFPLFTELISLGDTERLIHLYHRSAQLLTILIVVPSILVVLFSAEILFMWTGDPVLVRQTSLILSLLGAGTGISGLLRLPHLLQISYGWTSLGAAANAVSVVVGIPLLIWLGIHYGVVGAAFVWPLVNLAQLLVCVPIMHTRIAVGEMWRWYFLDVGAPCVAATVVALVLRNIVPEGLSRAESAVWLFIIAAAILLAACTASPVARGWAIRNVRLIGSRLK
ncbi:MAG TPA: oligosaccharide flippase family protein [Desulfomonilaceae bacterium]|nr:oligosaccharide flippase family protein [Desulfomonilaceae bacterium]